MLAARIHLLTALRLALAAGAVVALAPPSSFGVEGVDLASLVLLASPVLYVVLLALLLLCRTAGLGGAAMLLALGLVEGGAMGGALAVLGQGWIAKTIVTALTVGAAMFGGLALAGFHSANYGDLPASTRALTTLAGLVGTGAALALVSPNWGEVAVAWIAAGAGVALALQDLPSTLGQVGPHEAGLGAAVLGMSAILDSLSHSSEGVGHA